MKELLFLEDDKILNKGICMALEREGYKMTGCATIAEARKILAAKHFDMLILDANLPDGNGFRLCADIRKSSRVPVILLTARDMECDMVDGLDSGADDYIVKPVGVRVLCAHIQAIFRRTVSEEDKNVYRKPPFLFDFSKMEFYKADTPLELGRAELRLLYFLVVNANRTLPRERILDYVWTDGMEFVEDNALTVKIKRLREKLEDDPSRPQYIRTVYGLGYKWVDKEC